MNSKVRLINVTCISIAIMLLALGAVWAGQNHPRIACPIADSQSPQALNELTSDSHGAILGTKTVVNMGVALAAGGNYLRHAQADVTEDNAGNGYAPDVDPDDGGWDWVLTAPNFVHSASASPTNLYGVTALGLYYAYLKSSNASYMTAMQDAATRMVANASIRSASDPVFLMLFQDLPGVTADIYKNAAKAKFDGRIGTYGSATLLARYIRDARHGQGYDNGIIPWDIGAWAVAAQMLEDRYPSDPYDYAQAADDIAEVLYQDSFNGNPGYFDPDNSKNNGWDPDYNTPGFYWYTLGITGLLDAFKAANVHTDKIPGLLTILLACQYSGGAFSYCYGANTNDEDWQSTAYAVMSLARVDRATYQTNINPACYWLAGTQDPTSGAWIYSDFTHYPEVGGECTSALYFGYDAGFDAEIYAGCNHPCHDFCLDFKLTGTDIRFFHFEYELPGCIDYVNSSYSSVPGLVTWQTYMSGTVLNIDGTFDSPNFTGTDVKIGTVCFTHDGGCPNITKTLTCTYDQVRDGAGNLVDVNPGQAIINLDNTAPTKDHPGNQWPCYSAADDPDWSCWNLGFYKGAEEWQCDLLQATIRIYKAAGCNTSDLVFTQDFFTSVIPGDFTICYPTNQTEKNAIWSTLTSDGTYYVRLTVKDDCCNEANNCDAFTFCRDTHTDNYMTCVDAKPAHNHICLEWNYTYDATNAVKLRILRSPYRAGNYPEYTASNPVPSGYNDASWYQVYDGTATYPCDGATWFPDNGQGCNGGGSFFDNNTRDIYWYAGFTQDAAGNWSAADMTLGTGTDRATSYWLGDVAGLALGPPDGLVFGGFDLGRLTSAYGTSPPSPSFDNTVDYGPETQEHGIGRGIPTPDDVIGWKDLLPFSFNYNIVGPSGSCSSWPLLATNEPPRQLNKTAQPVSVWLEQVAGTQHDVVTFALMLTNPEDAIHLFHTQISYNSSVLSLKDVRRGEVGITEGATEFFASPRTGVDLVDVDLAALGPDAYVVGSGAVAYLDFSYKATEMPSKIALKETILYDGEGNEIDLSPTDVDVENQGELTPTEFALYYNHPNPFNPTTIIKYDLPQASYVKLAVYNVMGQKVATLVDGMVEAGRHQVIWDAKDVSSGVYFYKITAGNFTQMHKMILLK